MHVSQKPESVVNSSDLDRRRNISFGPSNRITVEVIKIRCFLTIKCIASGVVKPYWTPNDQHCSSFCVVHSSRQSTGSIVQHVSRVLLFNFGAAVRLSTVHRYYSCPRCLGGGVAESHRQTVCQSGRRACGDNRDDSRLRTIQPAEIIAR